MTDQPEDIAAWLGRIGLSEYIERFAQNRIDSSVLPDITDDDLKELGIVIGDRRKLLRAIKELDRSETPGPTVGSGAERRHLTVMFCDLVGSTALSTQLDPEDLREIIGSYHRCSASIIEQNGGFVAKYMGDGILAYFGYPQAHEHDAEHAVQAGLALVGAVPRLAVMGGASLSVRVGIAAGLVVVGDLLGSGEAQERGVVGETPNLAARLQGIAEPGMVVMSDAVRRLVGNLFELTDIGAQSLKGIDRPMQAWVPTRVRSIASRFDALHATTGALVGRARELELLLLRWEQVRGGEGQVVLLSGEAGIGKSRLTSAFLEQLASEPHGQLRYFCSPQRTDSAFHPFIDQLERAAGFLREDAQEIRLAKLGALLDSSGTPTSAAAFLAEMLSLPNDGRFPAPSSTPLQRRQLTIEAIVERIAALARETPVLAIFEDAHWSDPSSQDVLKLAMSRLAGHRVLLIMTFRPEFVPPWTASNTTELRLSRLETGDVAVMIDRVIGAGDLPPDVRQEIFERTDGIPLFVEEMTKAVLETRGDRGMRETAAAVPLSALGVPSSLHASLMARLDRLGPAKAIAQIAAAIGREFSYQLLHLVSRRSARELEIAIERLLAAGLLFRQGGPSDDIYFFNHALVQDAAYGSLLRETRRAMHARIADALEQHFAAVTDNQPEIPARHFAEAGLNEKAAMLWAKAGRRSLAASALKEAAEQLDRAQALIATLPGTAERRREQIRIQVALANALIQPEAMRPPRPRTPSTKRAF